MRIRTISFLLIIFLLLFSSTVSVIAHECVPACEGCQSCEAGVCVDDPDNCIPCQNCKDGECEDDDDLCEGCETCSIGYCDDDDDECPTGECCYDGTCGFCCWTLEEHPEGTGDCSCSEATGHCGTSIDAWSISTCERSASGAESCSVTYRQVGSRYACDESIDWINLFLCYSGQASECIAICSAGSAACIVDPPSCPYEANHCYECILEYIEGEPEDCGCLVVICDIGSVTHTLWANAGTLSGGSCP
jgi:hypothetical protein